DGDAHAVARDVQARAGTYILERAARQLLVETIGRAVGPVVLDEVDVLEAVVIEVEQCHAGPCDLGHEVAIVDLPRVVDEIDAQGLTHLLEPGRLRRALGFLWNLEAFLRASPHNAREQGEEEGPSETTKGVHAPPPDCW